VLAAELRQLAVLTVEVGEREILEWRPFANFDQRVVGRRALFDGEGARLEVGRFDDHEPVSKPHDDRLAVR
jgi:hypothetical protein